MSGVLHQSITFTISGVENESRRSSPSLSSSLDSLLPGRGGRLRERHGERLHGQPRREGHAPQPGAGRGRREGEGDHRQDTRAGPRRQGDRVRPVTGHETALVQRAQSGQRRDRPEHRHGRERLLEDQVLDPHDALEDEHAGRGEGDRGRQPGKEEAHRDREPAHRPEVADAQQAGGGHLLDHEERRVQHADQGERHAVAGQRHRGIGGPRQRRGEQRVRGGQKVARGHERKVEARERPRSATAHRPRGHGPSAREPHGPGAARPRVLGREPASLPTDRALTAGPRAETRSADPIRARRTPAAQPPPAWPVGSSPPSVSATRGRRGGSGAAGSPALSRPRGRPPARGPATACAATAPRPPSCPGGGA